MRHPDYPRALTSSCSARNPTSRPTLFPALALVIAVICAYANSLHAPFLFDDASSIQDNPSIRSLRTAFFPPGNSGLTVSGRPLLNASLSVNYLLGAETPSAYRITNIAIHTLTALLIFGLTRRTLALYQVSPGRNITGVCTQTDTNTLAFSISALWSLHPLQTESVTYIIQRAESLVALFFVGAFYCLSRSATDVARSRKWLAATVVCTLLGMGSKEVMAFAPLLLFAYDRTFISGSFRATWKARRTTYLLLAATWILLAICVLSTGSRGGTVGLHNRISPWSYLLTQCHAIGVYLKLILWPSPLILDYGMPVAIGIREVIWQAMALTTMLGISVWAFVKGKASGFLGLAFFATLAPSSSIVPVLTQTIAEHRIYLPLLACVTGFVVFVHRFVGSKTIIITGILSLTLGAATIHRNHDYRTEESIWRDVVAKRPDNTRAWLGLGSLYLGKKDFKHAEEAYVIARQLDPENVQCVLGYADFLSKSGHGAGAIREYQAAAKRLPDSHPLSYKTLNNLALLLITQGDSSAAIPYLNRAIHIDPKQQAAFFNLATALEATGQNEAAILAYKKALQIAPDSLEASANLGNLFIKLDQAAEAIHVLEKALEKMPASPELHINLGVALNQAGRRQEAIRQLRIGVEYLPKSFIGQMQLARTLMSEGLPDQAIAHFQLASNERPSEPTAFTGLGEASLAIGDITKAVTAYSTAVALAPNDAYIEYLLANALLQSGDLPRAAKHYERTLTLNPNQAEAHNELGIVFAQLGRASEARRQFEQALQVNPLHSGAAGNLARIQKQTPQGTAP